MMSQRRWVVIGLGVTLLSLVSPSGIQAQVADFTVSTTVDAIDATPGDGVCADATGACTLRAAIMEGNALAGAQTVFLPGGDYALSIPGANEDAAATGDLDITDDLVLESSVVVNGATEPGSTIDGAALDRVLHILGPVKVSISGVVVENGDVRSQFTNAGGILNVIGTIELSDSEVNNNRALGSAAIVNGGAMTGRRVKIMGNSDGGIFNSGSLTLDQALISQNTHTSGGSSGGAIFNSGSLIVQRSTITSNTSGGGGGISGVGDISLTDTAIIGNAADGLGGAVEFGAGNATLTNVLLKGNSAGGGGAIFNDGDGQLTLKNVTMSGNNAESDEGPFGHVPGRGGAILTHSGRMSLTNTTVVNNSADDEAGAIFLTDRPTPGFSGPEVNLKNSVLGNNTVKGAVSSCVGRVNSAGNNIEDGDSCRLAAAGDLVNTDPRLAPLADNGGPTQTHALLAGSPAIDAGDAAACPATDQRGVARPMDGNGDGVAVCDIGSFEAPAGTAAPSPSASPSGGTPAPGPVRLPATGASMESDTLFGRGTILVAALVCVATFLAGVRRFVRQKP